MNESETFESAVKEIVDKHFHGIMPTLHEAASQGCNIIVQYHINNGIDINSKVNRWDTPLHYATIHEHIDTVIFLIERGANVNAQDYNCNTPLLIAAKSGRLDIAEFLLKHGANINDQNVESFRPLHYASMRSTYMVTLLLKHGADILAEDQFGNTPLAYSNIETLRLLIKYLMENPSIKSKFDMKGFFWSAEHDPQSLSGDVIRYIWAEEEQIALGIEKFATIEAVAQTSYNISLKEFNRVLICQSMIYNNSQREESTVYLEMYAENVLAYYFDDYQWKLSSRKRTDLEKLVKLEKLEWTDSNEVNTITQFFDCDSFKPTNYLLWLPEEMILSLTEFPVLLGGNEYVSTIGREVELVENVFAKHSTLTPMLTSVAYGQRKRKRDEDGSSCLKSSILVDIQDVTEEELQNQNKLC